MDVETPKHPLEIPLEILIAHHEIEMGFRESDHRVESPAVEALEVGNEVRASLSDEAVLGDVGAIGDKPIGGRGIGKGALVV
mgnify:CR=1 FL=1